MEKEHFVTAILDRIAIAMSNEHEATAANFRAENMLDQQIARQESTIAVAQRKVLRELFPGGTHYLLKSEPSFDLAEQEGDTDEQRLYREQFPEQPYENVFDAVRAKVVYGQQFPAHRFFLVVFIPDQSGEYQQIAEWQKE
jgi:hypothetical protein